MDSPPPFAGHFQDQLEIHECRSRFRVHRRLGDEVNGRYYEALTPPYLRKI
jgi:hypothetical protein